MAGKRLLAMLLGVAVGIVAPVRARAACTYEPAALSYSKACAVGCLDSGSQTGDPATSSVSKGDAVGAYNFGTDAALTNDHGGFASSLHTGGSETIAPFASNGAGSNVIGDVFDCLTVSGGVGTARLHVPVALLGETSVSWAVGGAYVPPPMIPLAYTRVIMHCAPCSGAYDVTYDVSQPIDTTFELVFQIDFDQPLTIQYGPRISSDVAYRANGSDGTLQGTADIELQGRMLPAYVTDFGGNVYPNITVSATSGFDYLNPAPEPGAASAAAAAAAALITRARRRQTFAMIRSA